MDNIADLYQTLGVEMPQDQTGVQDQEVAEPEETGEQDQEVAEPGANDEGEDLEPEEETEPEVKPDKKPLTKEERAANAARRRQQEVDEKVNAALEKERAANKARWDKFFAQAQMKNQHQNGAVIDSLEKAEEWAEQDRLARLQQNLKKGNLTAEDLQTAMEQSPAFKELQQKQAAAEEKHREFDMAKFEQDTETQMAEIRKLNPKIQSLTDIIRSPQGKTFAVLVENANMDYLSAYKMAFHDQLVEQAQKAATASEQLKRASKAHLQPPSARGQGGVEVPKRIKELYRMGRPNMTDAEIEADYRKRAGKA